MRFCTLAVAAALAALLGTAGPALAHGDRDYVRRHDRWHQRYDRHHGSWHHSYWRPRYFWNHGGYGNGWYRSYDADPDCHGRFDWNDGWPDRRW